MRKIFYAFICIQISFLLLLCGCTRKETTKQGFEYYIASGYNYTLKDGKAVLIEKTVNKDDEIINLPDEIDGYPVIGIGRYHYTFIYGETTRGMFENNESIKTVVLPSKLEMLDSQVFNWSSIQCIEFPNTLCNVEQFALSSCAYLTDVKFGEGLKTISMGMFSHCTALGEISLPKSIEKIASYAFEGCESLEKIVIYNNCVEIDDTAFEGCDKLTIYGIKGSYAEQYANEHNIPFMEIKE